MKKIVAFIIFCLPLALSAQVVYDYLKAADDYFNKADYYSAAQYYEKYLSANKKIKSDGYDPYTINTLTKQQRAAVSNKQQATYKLAECYRHLNYPSKSAPLYAKASGFDKKEFPLASYWYGKSLRALASYDAADSVFTMFVDSSNASATYIDDAKREIKNLKFIKEQLNRKDTALYKVQKASNINADGANYAPVRLKNGKVYFTSTRKDTGANKNNVHNNRVYEATVNNDNVYKLTKVNVPITGVQHEGVVSLTPDATTMFLTGWTVTNGKKNSSLYYSKLVNGNWSAPTLLDAVINEAGSSNQQPFVMPDGKTLLFASNRVSGLGGFDIWSVNLNADGTVNTLTLKNLGAPVNTPYDEQAPYYHEPTNKLVFSSNGNIGMGGFDLFTTKMTGAVFAEPENLGYPVNSIKDDIYFTSNGNSKNVLGDVLFSSDRGSECCLETYTLSKIRPLKNINGTVVNCNNKEPVASAEVKVLSSAGKEIATLTTTGEGKYNFTTEDFDDFVTNASAVGYYAGTAKSAIITNDELITQTLTPVCLIPIPPPIDTPPPPKVDTVVVMDDIYFEFNKAEILPESYAAIDNQILKMLNQYNTMVIEIGGHTDSQGSDEYNLKLSQARAESVKKYLISKGIAPERLEAKGYGETKPVAPNSINGKDNPEGRKKNRRTEFKVLHY